MSAIKIQVASMSYGMSIARTTVSVDGKFAYQSSNAVNIEVKHLERLVELIPIENTEVVRK